MQNNPERIGLLRRQIRMRMFCVLGVVMICRTLPGQDASPKVAFEVATVKASPLDGWRAVGLFTYPGGRIHATTYTLKMLIHDAYDVEMYHIVGGPNWLDELRFDVEAKPPASSASAQWIPANFKSSPNPEMRQMLQGLLAERFQLKVHRETRNELVYALVKPKEHQLKPPADAQSAGFVNSTQTGLSGKNATMDQLVERLGSVLKRTVRNETGIQGNFDFLIDYPADDAGTDLVSRLLGALRDQTGLKLETRPGKTVVVVVDRAEKPTAN